MSSHNTSSPQRGGFALGPALGAPVLVNLPGRDDQEPVFYPVNLDALDADKELPPPPPQVQQSSSPAPVKPSNRPQSQPSTPVKAEQSTSARSAHAPLSPAEAALSSSNSSKSTPSKSTQHNMSNAKDSSNTDLPELPEAPPSRLFHQGYSAAHPVPTVQGYRDEKARHTEESKHYAELVQRRRQEADERDQRAEQVAAMPNGNGDVTQTQQVSGEETNAAKTQMDKTDKPNAGTGATEKASMMDQMNANQRECSVVGSS